SLCDLNGYPGDRLKIRRPLVFGTLAALILLIAVLSGCPLSFESEPRPNAAPTTFFLGEPSDTTFSNQMQFSWNGTDEDSDVVAYQFQLVYLGEDAPGPPVESIDPPNSTGEEEWSDRTIDDFHSFVELDDGFYEFRVRAVDQQGVPDPNPARHTFFVFFDDIAPQPDIISPPGEATRITATRINFLFTASDQSRNKTTLRSKLEYSYQLRATSLTACSSHTNDVFTDWKKFPSDSTVNVLVGDQAPTIYSDLFSNNCSWTFTLRVRDPANNIGTEVHTVTKIEAN
ncbi:MAG TPA: hypothetical protein VFR10_09700, partial [bacterium]|nr:hypothetical protein [bacterium]